jgi:hypothetical protein
MPFKQTLNDADAGSRLHFLLAIVVALLFAIGLTSTAAKAGLISAPELTTASAAQPNGMTPEVAAPRAVRAVVDESTGVPESRSLYLEEDEEFAPKFQHVVARGKPVRRTVLTQLACTLALMSRCGYPTVS